MCDTVKREPTYCRASAPAHFKYKMRPVVYHSTVLYLMVISEVQLSTPTLKGKVLGGHGLSYWLGTFYMSANLYNILIMSMGKGRVQGRGREGGGKGVGADSIYFLCLRINILWNNGHRGNSMSS